MTSDRYSYFQCPYCNYYEGGPGVRVPKTVGKYKIMVIHDTILKLKCSRCAKEHVIELKDGKKHMWSKMTRNKREEFKKEHYKGGKK